MNKKLSQTMKINLAFLSLLALLGILIAGYFGISLFLLHSNDLHNRSVIKMRTGWLQSNKDKIMYIFTDIFPKASECNTKAVTKNCEQDIRKMIDDKLTIVLGYGDQETGRLPIFFIRLKDQNTIEKLYQGGGFKEEVVDTKGEKMVAEMLSGTRDPFAYPQYNCCGGNDILPEIPILNLFLPVRRYLNDFPSEIEQIYLIRNVKNVIVGGLVYLYGD